MFAFLKNPILAPFLKRERKFIAMGVFWLLVVNALFLVPPFLIQKLIDHPSQFKKIALGFIFAHFGMAVGRYAWRRNILGASHRVANGLRHQLSRQLLLADPKNFEKKHPGEWISVMTSDVDAIRFALGPGLMSTADAWFFLLTVPVALMLTDWRLALMCLVPLSTFPFIVRAIAKRVRQGYQTVQADNERLSGSVSQWLLGYGVWKSMAMREVVRPIEQSGWKLFKSQSRLSRIQCLQGPILDFVLSFSCLCVALFGSRTFFGHEVSLGVFVAFQRYLQILTWPMMAFGMSAMFMARGTTSAERVREIPEAMEIKNATGSLQAIAGAPALEWRDRGIAIRRGDRAILSGSIGSGKSVLLNQITHVFGNSLADYSDAERSRLIKWVPERPFLFNESIDYNLQMGLDGSDPFEQKKENALRDANWDPTPIRFNQPLTEFAKNLSGGQRQRLTLARALMGGSKTESILIWDDALSSIDETTGARILAALKKRSEEGLTVLLSTQTPERFQGWATRQIDLDQWNQRGQNG